MSDLFDRYCERFIFFPVIKKKKRGINADLDLLWLCGIGGLVMLFIY